MDWAIHTEALGKRYGGVVALEGLDLEVNVGEVFGFLGPNGAGKTTTVRILTTLTRPSWGRAWVSGFDVVRNPVEAKTGMGMVPQYLNLEGELTARENLRLHAMLHGMDRALARRRIEEMLEFVGLIERADCLVRTFSGGMKRRLMLARALLHEPQVLFLDEPTVGLDPQTRRRIWDLIRRINRLGATVFLTTHYIEEAELLCHRVGIIDRGRLIALDSPQALLQRVGEVVVEFTSGDGACSRFFPNRQEAARWATGLQEDVIIRRANLEDVFLLLTGRRVAEE